MSDSTPSAATNAAMDYVPKPIDTSSVSLPPELQQLVELLAENAHENWSAEKIRQGWCFGVTDAAAKKHSDLKPYRALPESVKDYDRILAMETLRTIIKLGFRIVPPPK
jgi:hypothetical protein